MSEMPEVGSPDWEDHLYDLLERWEKARAGAASLSPVELFSDDPIFQGSAEFRDELRQCIADCGRFDQFERATRFEKPSIPGYKVVSEVGRGGMGVVYSAIETKLNRSVALKLIPSGELASPSAKQRFLREAKTLATLTHPNIIEIHSFGEHKGSPYLVMELMTSGNLASTWALNRPTPNQVAELVSDLAEAMEHAHQANIVHRDLKPSNILISDQGVPKIADFGLARDVEGTLHTASMSTIGTPGYMAPEQSRGAGDKATDIYGLGAVLYYGLTLNPPIRFSSVADFWRQIDHQQPISPKRLVPLVQQDLETICLKCLEKQPDRRYQTASKLHADLLHYLRREPISARPISRSEQAVRWCRRQPWRATAVALLMALVVVAVAAASRFVRNSVTERALREDAELQRGQAERSAKLSAIRQTRYQQSNAQIYLENARFNAARDLAISVPAEIASIDTKLLTALASNAPQPGERMADGHWGFLDVIQSPDGSRLVSADASGRVLVWDLTKGEMARELMRGRWSTDELRFQHHYIESITDADVQPRLGDPTTWGHCIVDLDWIPGTNACVGASANGELYRFDFDAQESLMPHVVCTTSTQLNSVAVSMDANKVVVGDVNGQLRLFDLSHPLDQTSSRELSSAISVVKALTGGWWLVGLDDGQVCVLRPGELEVEFSMKLPGPIWCIGVHNDLVAIGCQSSKLTIFQLADDRSLRFVDVLPLPSSPAKPDAVHAVEFVSDTRLLVGDNLGNLSSWNREKQKLTFSIAGILAHSLRSRLLQVHEQAAEEGLPPISTPFKRRVARIAMHEESERIMAAGADATIKTWSDSQGIADVEKRLATTIGANPRIVFDPTRPEIVWGLDLAGELWAFDTNNDCVLDRIKAHRRQEGIEPACDIATGSREILTVGCDNNVCIWSLSGHKIKLHRKMSESAPLLGVAVCPNDRWVASVDVQANLSVRTLADGKRVYSTRLPGESDERPLTGRLGFNRDGSRLAAFGKGQSGALFSTEPFRQLDDQFQVAGKGGLALAWSPASPDVLHFSDDYHRLTSHRFDSNLHWSSEPSTPPQTRAIAIVPTSDGRRVATLEKDGSIVFYSAEHMFDLMTVDRRSKDACDLAFSSDNNRIAVSWADGEISVWPVVLEDNVIQPPNTPMHRWDRHQILAPVQDTLMTYPRSIRVDPQGRLGLLLTRSRPDDEEKKGAVYFARLDEDQVVLEQIVIDGTERDRRISSTSLGLEFQAHGEPIAAFRRQLERSSPYDASFHLAHRSTEGGWHFETIFSGDNMGEYPLIQLNDQSQVDAVLHYRGDGRYLMRSVPSKEMAGLWETKRVGIQGDGLYLDGYVDQNQQIHMVFHPIRLDGDPAPHTYLHLDGNRVVARESMSLPLTGVECTPSEMPVVVRKVYSDKNSDEEFELARRGPKGWERLVGVPSGIYPSDFAVANDGSIFLLAFSAQRDELWLWKSAEHGRARQVPWTRELVASFDEHLPYRTFIRLDHRDQPHIVIGSFAPSNVGWIDFYVGRKLP